MSFTKQFEAAVIDLTRSSFSCYQSRVTPVVGQPRRKVHVHPVYSRFRDFKRPVVCCTEKRSSCLQGESSTSDGQVLLISVWVKALLAKLFIGTTSTLRVKMLRNWRVAAKWGCGGANDLERDMRYATLYGTDMCGGTTPTQPKLTELHVLAQRAELLLCCYLPP
ncbi:hypothetical protein E2C01_030642 [Portunus trituberculatus]|uniref:Uncharacterized protein n=1 Tax=Portunus trituberculatus TaxID=210409 RepID=A0A5B7EVT6_PORTR|nr:hypothetical protein [Portunus trituberculatus]